MPKNTASSGTIQAKRKQLPFDNAGEVILLYNPASYVPGAEEAGVAHHRDNTPWYLTVPSLNVTIPMIEDGTPVTGFVYYTQLYRLADSIITQLKSLKPDELRKYQTEVPEFRNFPMELREKPLFYAKVLPATGE